MNTTKHPGTLIASVVASALLFASAASSQEVYASQLNKIGAGDFSWFGISLYTAGLWRGDIVDQNGNNENTVLLSLKYNKTIPKKRIIKITKQEWQRLNTGSPEQRQAWINHLQNILPDVSSGDRLSSLITESGKIRFLHDDKVIGEVVDPEFGRAFLSIWLHPDAKSSGLRNQLLGSLSDQTELFDEIEKATL